MKKMALFFLGARALVKLDISLVILYTWQPLKGPGVQRIKCAVHSSLLNEQQLELNLIDIKIWAMGLGRLLANKAKLISLAIVLQL